MFERKVVALLFVVLPLFSIQHSAFGQAPAYSREAVAARERSYAERYGIKMRDENPNLDSRLGGNMLMTGTRAIGDTRRDIRNREGGETAMLRYEQHREIKPPAHSTLKIGPWYTDLGVGLSVGAQYIRMSGNGLGFIIEHRRGKYLKDGFDIPIISTIYMNNYIILTRNIDFSFNIDVSYAYYPFETQEDYLSVDMSDEGVYATFSTAIQLSRNSRLLLYDGILYRTDYIDTRGMQDVYGGEQYEHFENTAGADWDWMVSQFDNISASISRRDIISFSEEFDDQEGVFYAELVAYQRELSRFASVGTAGEFSQSLYEVDSRPDINMYDFSVFSVVQLTRKLYGNASLGYGFSTYSYDSYDTDGSPIGSLGLGHKISENRYQELTYRKSRKEAFRSGVDIRDTLQYRYLWRAGVLPGSFSSEYIKFSPTDDGRGDYSSWLNRVDLYYQMSRLWRLGFYTSYDVRMNNPFDFEINPDTPDTNSDYSTWKVHLGVDRPVTKNIKFVIYLKHAERFSDDDDLKYVEDAIVARFDWKHEL